MTRPGRDRQGTRPRRWPRGPVCWPPMRKDQPRYSFAQMSAAGGFASLLLLSLLSGPLFGGLSDRLGRRAGLVLVFSFQLAAYFPAFGLITFFFGVGQIAGSAVAASSPSAPGRSPRASSWPPPSPRWPSPRAGSSAGLQQPPPHPRDGEEDHAEDDPDLPAVQPLGHEPGPGGAPRARSGVRMTRPLTASAGSRSSSGPGCR
jgi:hypothetical protein